MANNIVYLTKEWLVKLQEELNFLKNTRRVEIANKLKEAISFWDLSENSEYEDARNEQAQVEVRIIELEEQLKNYEIIDEEKNKNSWWSKKNTVNIWSIVEIENEKWEKTELKIVGSTESDILAELPTVSNESPIWNALLWKEQWDSIAIKVASGSYKYKILKIK
jgi:transcription elongation factor GreA